MKKLFLLCLVLSSCAHFDTGGSVGVVRGAIPALVKEVVNSDPDTRLVFLHQSKNVEMLVYATDTRPSSLAIALDIAPDQTVETQTITNGLKDIYEENYECTHFTHSVMMPLLMAISDSLNPDKK